MFPWRLLHVNFYMSVSMYEEDTLNIKFMKKPMKQWELNVIIAELDVNSVLVLYENKWRNPYNSLLWLICEAQQCCYTVRSSVVWCRPHFLQLFLKSCPSLQVLLGNKIAKFHLQISSSSNHLEVWLRDIKI